MKQSSIIILPLLLFVFSCSKELAQVDTSSTRAVLSVTTKTDNPKDQDSLLVSERALMQYVKYRSLERKEELTVRSITPFYGSDGFPVAYLLNYTKGWELVSADKRATPRLAYSEEGELEMEKCPDTQNAWIETVLDEIKVLRKMTEEQFLELPDAAKAEMMDNLEFWQAITISPSFLSRILEGGLRDDPLGYYELDAVSVDTLQYETVNHLISVHWHQGAPYNNYCPLRTDVPTLRAPAGCGAVAAAQILWYLHMHYGYPVYAPTSATCTGNVDSYTMTQSGQSSTIWSLMPLEDDAVAVLMAKVGTMVGMNYSNTGSSSYASYYPSLVFAPFGVDCDLYNSFNMTIASNNLLNGRPLFAYARTANYEGHAFVIDGYKAYHVVHTIRYRWVSTDPSPDPQTIIFPYYYEYTYEDPFIREISMNWGWGATYDTGWYTDSGSWTLDIYSFDYQRGLIANFSALTQ